MALPIVTWLTTARALADEYDLSELSEQLGSLHTELARPGFRVCVAGEASGGKRGVFNLMLGRDLVPAADTDEALFAVSAGARDSMTVTFLDSGPAERRDTADAATVAALAAGRAVDTVQAQLTGSFLAQSHVELVSTPGLNLSRRADQAASAMVSTSDMVVMVVSAIAPMSQSELAFLSDVMRSAYVPNVALVVANLEHVDEDDRPAALEAIKRRASSVAADLDVYVAPSAGSSGDMDRLRAEILARSVADEWVALRDHQLAWQLTARVGRMAEVGRHGLEVAKLSEEDQRNAAKQAAEQNDAAEVRWLELRTELADRGSATAADLRRRLDQDRDQLTSDLQHDVRAAADPAAWWETRLADELRRRLDTLSATHNRWLTGQVETDLHWLDAEIAEMMSDADSLATNTHGEALRTVPLYPDRPRVADLRRAKVLYRFGPAGVLFVGALLIPGIGPSIAVVAAGAAFLVGDMRYRGLAKEQVEVVARAVRQVVDQAIDDLLEAGITRLRTAYANAGDAVLTLNRAWRRDRSTVTAAAGSTGDVERWQRLAREADALALIIATELQKNPIGD